VAGAVPVAVPVVEAVVEAVPENPVPVVEVVAELGAEALEHGHFPVQDHLFVQWPLVIQLCAFDSTALGLIHQHSALHLATKLPNNILTF
jgi:hypothetical protein